MKPSLNPKLIIPEVRSIIAIASGKGGVGKSTVTTNLAIALKNQGVSVGILDADIYGPSIPKMFGVNEKPQTDSSGKILPISRHGIPIMSMGFLVPEESPLIWRGPIVQGALTKLLKDVAWSNLDILLIDMPPGTGDVQLTIAQKLSLNAAIIVSTPQDIALIDARKGLNMFVKVGVPIIGMIENMSYFTCPHCQKNSNIFAHGSIQAEAKRLKCEFLGAVPLNICIRESCDAGAPFMTGAQSSLVTQTFAEISSRVLTNILTTGENFSKERSASPCYNACLK